MTSLRHLRSSTANKRPDPAAMVDGQLAMNYDIASPGLFFKDDNGTLIKVGPVHVGTTAPNVSPAAGGTAGNSIGEQWLDTTSGVYVLKVWDGSAWRSESGTFVDVSGDTMTGALTMANQQAVRFSETTANGSNYIALQATAALASNKTITLPDTTGTVVTTGDTGTVTSTMIANDTILNADINASAAIAGTKISPDFGSQTIATTGIFSSAAGTAAAPSIAFTGDTNTGIYSPGADQLALSTAGNGRLFIDGTGFVGIGTVPSPGYGLDVRGFTRLSTVGGASGLEIGNGTATNQFASVDLVGDTTYPDYGLRLLRGNSGANASSNIAHKGTGALSLITEETAPIVLVTSNTERVRIDSSGSVGIGTTSPLGFLHIETPATTAGWQLRLDSVGLANESGFYRDASDNYEMVLRNGLGGLTYLKNNGNATDANLVFFPNGVERVRVDSSGRLLVGTTINRDSRLIATSFSSSLQIESNSEAAQSITRWSADSNSSRLHLQKGRGTIAAPTIVLAYDDLGDFSFSGYDGANMTNGARISAHVDGNPSANDMPGRLVFSTTADGAASPTPRMTITSTGNVGIGTTSPTTPLEVSGSSAQIRVIDSAVDLRLLPLAGSNVGIVGTVSNHALSLFTNNAERARIDSSGRVGIGTSSPATSLDVQLPAASATLGNIRVSPTGTGQARYHLYNGGQVCEWLFGQKTNTDHSFKVSKSVAGSEADFVAIGSSGIINIAIPPTYADNAAATSGGLVAGDIYRKSDGTLMIRY